MKKLARLSPSAILLGVIACDGLLGIEEGRFQAGSVDGSLDSGAKADGGPSKMDGGRPRGDGAPPSADSGPPKTDGRASVPDAALDGGASDAACDASTLDDPLNCGRCGHNCLTGACVGGACQPVAITSGAECPYGLSADSPYLYWSEGCETVSIVKCEFPPACKPTGVPAVVTPTGGNVSWISAYGGNSGGVFWADNGMDGEISACPTSAGCPLAPQLLGSGLGTVTGLSAYGNGVYYSNEEGVVGWIDFALGTAGQMSVLDGGTPRSVVAQTALVAWAQPDGVFLCPVEMPCPTPTQVSVHPSDGVAMTSDRLFWTDSTGVYGCTLPCSTGASQLSTMTTGDLIVGDDAAVFWSVDGDLFTCPAGGCPGGPTELATSSAAYALALDPRALYWIDGTSVMMVAR